MKKAIYLVFTLLISVMIIGILPVRSEAAIYDNVLRLHVIANSDSDADQSLKLKVRDAILEKVSSLVADAKSFDEAISIISTPENQEKLTEVAISTIKAEGYDYAVSISLGKENYPRKNYESLCFPSGEYTSLQVKIGDAVGQNWWCVLFPSLCLGSASKVENEEKFIEAGFTPEQYKIVTESQEPQYEVKFKILEIIEETFKG